VTVKRSDVTTWFEGVVRAATPASVALYVGVVPPGAKYPYSVLYSIDGGAWDGSLSDGQDMPTFVYQVDFVTRAHKAAEDGGALIQAAVFAAGSGAAGNPTGATVSGIIPDGGPGGVETIGEPPLEVFTQQSRYAVTVTATE